jgi:hypothetical protein
MGSALEALGLRLGTALILEMNATDMITSTVNPWPVVTKILEGKKAPPQEAYKQDLALAKPVWEKLPDERRALLQLLSRFDLTSSQAFRFFDPQKRSSSFSSLTTDDEIIQNPYILVERDLGSATEIPVAMEVIDRGLLPDEIAGSDDPVPPPSVVSGANDPRRVRCAVVQILRRAANSGDTLLSLAECQTNLEKTHTKNPIQVTTDWLRGHGPFVSERIIFAVLSPDGKHENNVEILQLAELNQREKRLRKVLIARALKVESSLKADWKALLISAIENSGNKIDQNDERHNAALAEQAKALENITSRRLSVLVGRAGTGKTSVVGALVGC